MAGGYLQISDACPGGRLCRPAPFANRNGFEADADTEPVFVAHDPSEGYGCERMRKLNSFYAIGPAFVQPLS